MRPTPHPDVNEALLLLWEQQQQVLGDRLVGLYLGGSLALGDFDPGSSDIDFLAVMEEPVPGSLLPRLQAMHDRIRTSGLYWASHLEGSYIPRAALHRYDPSDCRHPNMGVDWLLDIHPHDRSWVIWRWTIREKGVTVWGPPPASLIDPVTAQELRDAVCSLLREVWSASLDAPEWLRPRNYQAYAILTMCRARYALATGAIVSKQAAAAWARGTLPQWAHLIDRALLWRHDTQPDDMAEMLAFVRETVENSR